MLHVPNAPCTLLSQAKMWLENRWSVRLEDTLQITLSCGAKLRVHHDNLYRVPAYEPGVTAAAQGASSAGVSS